MTVRRAAILSALIVASGAVWSIWTYLENRGTDAAALGFAGALSICGISLAAIWFGVLVASVLKKARPSDARRP